MVLEEQREKSATQHRHPLHTGDAVMCVRWRRRESDEEKVISKSRGGGERGGVDR